jgi:hypothetical protein
MKSLPYFVPALTGLIQPLLVGSLLLNPLATRAADLAPPFDDFTTAEVQPSGLPRMVITDQEAGGSSHAEQSIEGGLLTVSGSLKPGRGMPGFVILPLVLSADGGPRDLSQYEGVRLMVKVHAGNLTVQVSSTEITNFDYHTSAPIGRHSEGIKEVKIPFSSLKQMWSAPTKLNLATITSINLVAAGGAPAEFSYVVDEVGFY